MENLTGEFLGRLIGCLLLGFIASLCAKDKHKKFILFLFVAILPLALKMFVEMHQPITKTPAVQHKYTVNLPKQQSMELTSENNKISVSRPAEFSAQQIFLDFCLLSSKEQYIFENNMEFQKAFTIIVSIEIMYMSINQLSKQCYSADFLNTDNQAKLQVDNELIKSKNLFIKHLGQQQFDCFETSIQKELISKLAPAVTDVLYPQIQQQIGTQPICTLLTKPEFQTGMYNGILKNLHTLINNNDPYVWKLDFTQNYKKRIDYDVQISDPKTYVNQPYLLNILNLHL